MSSWDQEVYDQCRGAAVKAVNVVDNELVELQFEDGRRLSLGLDADCCSSSFYTDPKQFEELVGATIQVIEERDDDKRAEELDAVAVRGEEWVSDHISWHFLVFITNKGHVTIDWRNDSNGYYDGTVRPSLASCAT